MYRSGGDKQFPVPIAAINMTDKTDFDGMRPPEHRGSGPPNVSHEGFSRPKSDKVGRALLWTAFACGAIPLAVGSAIYFTFRVTRHESLAIAGIYTILGGLSFFAVGVMCLAAHVYWRRDFDVATLLLGSLLLSNFPAAAIYGLSAIGLTTQYVVQVINGSDVVVDSFIVEGGGVHVEFGPIQVGESKQCRVFFDADGTLRFKARQQQLRFDGEIEGYVTRNVGGMATVQIKPDGKFEVLRAD
jgi:hypothetical protein